MLEETTQVHCTAAVQARTVLNREERKRERLWAVVVGSHGAWRLG
jgi:hypothetical protein